MQRFQRSSAEIEVRNYHKKEFSQFSKTQTQGRLKNLKHHFTITERDQNQGYAIKWKFFDRMKKILESAQKDNQNDLPQKDAMK